MGKKQLKGDINWYDDATVIIVLINNTISENHIWIHACITQRSLGNNNTRHWQFSVERNSAGDI
jgi:hypothetical protein